MAEFHLEFGERVTASVRKHWFVLLLELIPYAFFAWLPTLIPGVITWVLSRNGDVDPRVERIFSLENPWITFLLGLWWLLMWVGAWGTFTRYYLNMWMITTTRIVYIYQHGFFHRQVSSFLLSRVQDVTTEVNGIFGTLLNYGSLNVQTAGENSKDFLMRGVPHPTHLRDLIMREIANLHSERQNQPNIVQKVVNEII
jgi:hypothetical protein